MELWAKKERERKEKEAKRKAQTVSTSLTSTIQTNTETNSNSNASASSTFTDLGLPAVRPSTGLISLSLSSNSTNSSSLHAPVNRPALLAAFDDAESEPEENIPASQSSKQSSNSSTSNAPEATEEKLVDWTKLMCLLCQRQFDTREILEKHIHMSNLHKVSSENNHFCLISKVLMKILGESSESWYRQIANSKLKKIS